MSLVALLDFSALVFPLQKKYKWVIKSVGLSCCQCAICAINVQLILADKMPQLPNCASQSLNGSAFGDGMDCMSRKSCSVSATSVILILPSSAAIFNCPNLWDSSLPSAFSFVFKAFQYFLGLGQTRYTLC